MRGHFRRQPRSAGLRGEGAGAVPVRAPDPDLPAAQPAPGAARRALRRLPSHRLPRHQHLHAPDRRMPERQCSNGGGPGPHGPAEHRRHPASVLVDHPELYSGKHKTTGLNVQGPAPSQEPWPGSPTPRTEGSTTLRPCAAADYSTYRPPTYPTGHHHHAISATRGTSDWA